MPYRSPSVACVARTELTRVPWVAVFEFTLSQSQSGTYLRVPAPPFSREIGPCPAHDSAIRSLGTPGTGA